MSLLLVGSYTFIYIISSEFHFKLQIARVLRIFTPIGSLGGGKNKIK